MTGAQDVGTFIAFRFFSGASAFAMLAAVPLLMNEIVPSHLRGALVDLHGVFLVLGYTIQGWVGFGFYFWDGGVSTWRPTVGLSCLWPLLLLAGLPWIPESPRWLCMQGRPEEAERVLIKLHTNKTDPNHETAGAEYYQIRKQIAIDRTLGSSWLHIWRKPSYRKRALLAIGTTGIIQCSGVRFFPLSMQTFHANYAQVLVINNYGPSLYAQLGFSPVKQLLYPAAWLTFAFGMNILGMVFVDRFPRPKYMGVGILGAQMTLIIEAALVANFVPSDNTAALQAAVAMFFVYQIFYGAMLDGTQFSYLGEIFPTHLRAKGICLGVAMISLMNIIWLQSAPTAFDTIGWKFYLALIIPGTLGGFVVFFLFPDTHDRPLEEIAEIFGDKDEVAIYQRDVIFDPSTHAIIENDARPSVEKENIDRKERVGA